MAALAGCRALYFCPSCHQKRVLQFGAWVAEEVLAPVPHRQYVFTVPKMLRVYFRRDRRLLGKLSQCAAEALKTLFRAAGKDPKVVPGIIIVIQTYGDLVNFHPHLHALVTDGIFTPTGWFVAFPKIDLYTLEHLFRHRVLRMLLRERRIDETVIRKLLGWRHSGFSLHNEVRIGAADSDGRRGVAEYILRSPFSLEKLRYQASTGTIIYQSKMHPVLKRNFEIFSACDWLAALTGSWPMASPGSDAPSVGLSTCSRSHASSAVSAPRAMRSGSRPLASSSPKRSWNPFPTATWSSRSRGACGPSSAAGSD